MSKPLQSLGTLLMTVGGGGIALGLALLLGLAATSAGDQTRALGWLGQVFLMISLFLLLPTLAVGVLLRHGREWLTRNPFAGKSALLLTIAGVGAGFVVVIRAGFWIHDQRPPAELSEGLVLGAALLLTYLIVAFVVGRVYGATGAPRRLPLAASANTPLAAPAKVLYTTRNPSPLPRSQWPPPRAVDPAELATCEHLRPVEQAMRGAGIAMRTSRVGYVSADCRISQPEFLAEFGDDLAALYGEHHEIDRSVHDPKTALFHCWTCRASLVVVHPEEAAAGTPWFPAG